MTRLIADQLRHRARSHGGDPLVTYYDLGTGERTELSGTSFLNWVDKASNLLTDEYLLDPGSLVDLELARTAPGHWMTLVLTTACWQVGAVVSVGQGGPGAALVVLGPDWAEHDLSRPVPALACSLHPMGLGFTTPLPPAVADFSLEVRGQSDYFPASPRSADEHAWSDGTRRLRQGDLVAAPSDPAPRRRLVRTTDPWRSVHEGVVVPVLTGGSAVLVVGDNPVRLERVVESERVDLTAGSDVDAAG